MGFFFPTLFLEINTVFLSRGAPFKKLLAGYFTLRVRVSIVIEVYLLLNMYYLQYQTILQDRATRKTFRDERKKRIPPNSDP